MSRGKLLAWVGILLSVAGCLGGPPDPDALGDVDATGGQSRPVVVALIDTGINPYHAHFAAPVGQGAEAVASIANATVVRLSQEGSYEPRLREDEAFWGGLELGRLYAFEGTRVLGISISHHPERPRLMDTSEVFGHGTMTSGMAAREAPEALVVMVQVNTVSCDREALTTQCPIVPPLAAGLAWAAQQPWIDVISMSLGVPANPPGNAALQKDFEALLAASRLAHESGKIVVAGSGNTVVPPLFSGFAGPPWVVAVGGFHPRQQGEAVQASRGVDVVANFSDFGPRAESVSDYGWGSGTSVAAPIVAGVLAKALLEVRGLEDEDGPPLAARLRAALNASAVLAGPADWNPAQPTTNDTLTSLVNPSAPILVAPLQQGWGAVDGSLVPDIVRRVREDDLAPQAEKAAAVLFQDRLQGLREAYWSRQG